MNRRQQKQPALPTELRDWLDRVIVPALVREYLAENPVASEAAPVAKCAAKSTASASVGGVE